MTTVTLSDFGLMGSDERMDFDGRRPLRTTVRLLAPRKWRIALATVAFAVKDSPIWLLPLITANIIDVVVAAPAD